MSVRWQHSIAHVVNIQKPGHSSGCLLGLVPQPTDSRLSETSICAYSNFLEDNISCELQNSQWMVCYPLINVKCVFSCKCYKTHLSLFQPWAVDKEVIDAGELNSLNPPKQNGDMTKEQEANEVV